MNTCPGAHTSSQSPRAHVSVMRYPSVLHGVDMRFMNEVAQDVEDITRPTHSKSLQNVIEARPCSVICEA